jgi:NAD(P)-dependent dehydrogenase (short-subunit alcohol dehydrogenase family)
MVETARHFHAQGWNVIATMRTPRPELLPRSERLRVLGLDVTKPESIEAALQASGPIDALVNNAGIGLFGAFEAADGHDAGGLRDQHFRRDGDDAVGASAVSRAQVRVVVNVTSSATLMPMPLVAVYTASKTAIEGFTASLAFELEAFNVRVKLVEPGYGPNTRFTSNTGPRMDGLIPEPYVPFAQSILASVGQRTAVTTEFDVAEAGVPGRDRCVWPAAFSSGRRRGGAGSVDIGDHVVARSGAVPAHAVERDWRHGSLSACRSPQNNPPT